MCILGDSWEGLEFDSVRVLALQALLCQAPRCRWFRVELWGPCLARRLGRGGVGVALSDSSDEGLISNVRATWGPCPGE
jgi:hypothetical protein